MLKILLAALVLVGIANFVVIFAYLLRHNELKDALYLNANHTLGHLRTETSFMLELSHATLPNIEKCTNQLSDHYLDLERERHSFTSIYKGVSGTMQKITQEQRNMMTAHGDMMDKLTRTQNHLSKAIRQRDKLRKQVDLLRRRR